ncbi:hypothetical protein Tco_0339691 [Tanacetum coccineum]
MHNIIMAAGSKRSSIDGLGPRKIYLSGVSPVERPENILPVAAHEEAETIHNMTTENKLYFQAEKEAIFLILTGIGDEIYSTVDAMQRRLRRLDSHFERLAIGNKTEIPPKYTTKTISHRSRYGKSKDDEIVGGKETSKASVSANKMGYSSITVRDLDTMPWNVWKPKRLKDYNAYAHKEKMMMCKQAEQGVPASSYEEVKPIG